MAFVVGTPDDVGPLGHFVNVAIAIASNDEEGRLDVVSGQNIEEIGSIDVGAVVEGDGYVAVVYAVVKDAAVWYRADLRPGDVPGGAAGGRWRWRVASSITGSKACLTSRSTVVNARPAPSPLRAARKGAGARIAICRPACTIRADSPLGVLTLGVGDHQACRYQGKKQIVMMHLLDTGTAQGSNEMKGRKNDSLYSSNPRTHRRRAERTGKMMKGNTGRSAGPFLPWWAEADRRYVGARFEDGVAEGSRFVIRDDGSSHL